MKRIVALLCLASIFVGCGKGPTLSGTYVDSDWPMARVDNWQFNTDGTWSQATTYKNHSKSTVVRSGTYNFDGEKIELYSKHLVEHESSGDRQLQVPEADIPDTLSVVHRNKDLVLTKNNGSSDTVLHPANG